MIRLSDALFISSEPDYDTVIAIRIKNGEYYFLGWMENTEGYKYVIAKHPEENLLDSDWSSDVCSSDLFSTETAFLMQTASIATL